MFYYAIAISLLTHFLLKLFSQKLRPVAEAMVRLHFFCLGWFGIDVLLLPLGWKLAGAYSTGIVISLAFCTGIISAVFYPNSQQRGLTTYFLCLKGITILLVVVGMIPVISGYGAGFVKDLVTVNYQSYPAGKGYTYRVVKHGVANCRALHLYHRFLIFERDIPVISRFNKNYDCFDPDLFTIVEAGRDTIVAQATFPGYETQYLILDKRTQKLHYQRYWDGYTLKDHTISFGLFTCNDSMRVSHLEVDSFTAIYRAMQIKYGVAFDTGYGNIFINKPDSNDLKAMFSAIDSADSVQH